MLINLINKFFALNFSILLMVTFADIVLSQTSSMNGEQIVRRMGEQYAKANSYQDLGEVHLISSKNQNEIDNAIAFKTYFLRPNKLRFEWEDNRPPNKYWTIVWNDGKDTFTYGDLNELEKNRDLMNGIAGATGVSLGSSHTVPVLLMKELVGFRLTEMSNISLLREEQSEGEDCFVVRGYHPLGGQIDLWISRNDFLLRKELEYDNGTFKEQIRRNIKINEAISNETFQYTPPQKNSQISYCLPTIILPLGLFLIMLFRK